MHVRLAWAYAPDPWIERLARLFRPHPAWRRRRGSSTPAPRARLLRSARARRGTSSGTETRRCCWPGAARRPRLRVPLPARRDRAARGGARRAGDSRRSCSTLMLSKIADARRLRIARLRAADAARVRPAPVGGRTARPRARRRARIVGARRSRAWWRGCVGRGSSRGSRRRKPRRPWTARSKDIHPGRASWAAPAPRCDPRAFLIGGAPEHLLESVIPVVGSRCDDAVVKRRSSSVNWSPISVSSNQIACGRRRARSGRRSGRSSGGRGTIRARERL